MFYKAYIITLEVLTLYFKLEKSSKKTVSLNFKTDISRIFNSIISIIDSLNMTESGLVSL